MTEYTDNPEELIALRDALASPAGHIITQAALAYMVTVSGMGQANPEWIKGIGLLLGHFKDIPAHLNRLKDNR